MEPKTLEALKASIAKWDRNVEAATPEEVRVEGDDCPLCVLFFERECVGCPVRMRKVDPYCIGTPYKDAYLTYLGWGVGERTREQYQIAARAEVEFLKSLLPVEA